MQWILLHYPSHEMLMKSQIQDSPWLLKMLLRFLPFSGPNLIHHPSTTAWTQFLFQSSPKQSHCCNVVTFANEKHKFLCSFHIAFLAPRWLRVNLSGFVSSTEKKRNSKNFFLPLFIFLCFSLVRSHPNECMRVIKGIPLATATFLHTSPSKLFLSFSFFCLCTESCKHTCWEINAGDEQQLWRLMRAL